MCLFLVDWYDKEHIVELIKKKVNIFGYNPVKIINIILDHAYVVIILLKFCWLFLAATWLSLNISEDLEIDSCTMQYKDRSLRQMNY